MIIVLHRYLILKANYETMIVCKYLMCKRTSIGLVRGGHLDVVDLLIENGIDVNVVNLDIYCVTPLHITA
jgi:hypothetical protein